MEQQEKNGRIYRDWESVFSEHRESGMTKAHRVGPAEMIGGRQVDGNAGLGKLLKLPILPPELSV